MNQVICNVISVPNCTGGLPGGGKSKAVVTTGDHATNAATNAALQAEVATLKREIASMNSLHETQLKLEAAEERIKMQPKLESMYKEGYAAAQAALKEARDMFQMR
jgi:hypothetical protein